MHTIQGAIDAEAWQQEVSALQAQVEAATRKAELNGRALSQLKEKSLRQQREEDELREQLDQALNERDSALAACRDVQAQLAASQAQVSELQQQLELLDSKSSRQAPASSGPSPSGQQISGLLEANSELRQQVLDAEERARQAEDVARNAERRAGLHGSTTAATSLWTHAAHDPDAAALREEVHNLRLQLADARQQVVEAEQRAAAGDAAQEVAADTIRRVTRGLELPPSSTTDDGFGPPASMGLLQAELDRLRHSNQQLQQQLADADQRIAILQRSGNSASADVVLLQADVQALQQARNELREQLVDAERRLASRAVEAEAWGRERATLHTRLGQAEARVVTLTSDVEGLVQQLRAAQAVQQEAERKLQAVRVTSAAAEQEVAREHVVLASELDNARKRLACSSVALSHEVRL